jgi:hypothetical protein
MTQNPILFDDAPDPQIAPAEIHLHIERLVLEGLPFNEHQSARLGKSFTAELTRRLQANPPLSTLLTGRRLIDATASARFPAGVTPEAAGRALVTAFLGPAYAAGCSQFLPATVRPSTTPPSGTGRGGWLGRTSPAHLPMPVTPPPGNPNSQPA